MGEAVEWLWELKENWTLQLHRKNFLTRVIGEIPPHYKVYKQYFSTFSLICLFHPFFRSWILDYE